MISIVFPFSNLYQKSDRIYLQFFHFFQVLRVHAAPCAVVILISQVITCEENFQVITCEERARVDSVCPKHGVCHPRFAIQTDKPDYFENKSVHLLFWYINWCWYTAAVRLGRSLEKAIAASFKVPSMQSQERQMQSQERPVQSQKRWQLCPASNPIQQNPKLRLLSPNVSWGRLCHLYYTIL